MRNKVGATCCMILTAITACDAPTATTAPETVVLHTAAADITATWDCSALPQLSSQQCARLQATTERVLSGIESLEQQGVLNRGQAHSLRTKVAKAIDALLDGRYEPSRNLLGAVGSQLIDFVATGVLTEAQANPISDDIVIVASRLDGIGSIIYTNLGPNLEFGTQNGWSVGYPFTETQVGQSMAVSFVPWKEFKLQSIDVPVSSFSIATSHDIVIALYSDLNGRPDAPIFSLRIAVPVLDAAPPTPMHVEVSDDIVLSTGTKYWLGLHPADPQPTDVGWWWNVDGDGLTSVIWQSNSRDAVLFGGSWERTFFQIEPGVQVNGIGPEPAPASVG